MEDPDPHHNVSGRRLGFSTENFDDYLVALMADLRNDTVCDRLLSGELRRHGNPARPGHRTQCLLGIHPSRHPGDPLVVSSTTTFSGTVRRDGERVAAGPYTLDRFLGPVTSVLLARGG